MKLAIASLIILGLFFGCSSSTNPAEPEAAVDKDRELVNHLTETMLAPRLSTMVVEAQGLKESVARACSGESVEVAKLQATWKKAMQNFHYTEVFIYGPLLIEEEDKLGDTNPIKNVIYSLQDPDKQAAVIDREMQKAHLQQDKYKLRTRPNIIGLDAIEYVLFAALKDQDELSETSESCIYLRAITEELVIWVDKVHSNFLSKVYNPLQTPDGQTRSRFFINQYTKGLITFTDKELKDRKLGAPLGIATSENYDCELGVNCHTLYIEHQFSQTAHQSALANLQAIHDAFEGTSEGTADGFGYSDYIDNSSSDQLKSFAEERVVKRVKVLPQGADYAGAFASYQGDENPDHPAYAAYKEIQKLTTWLKTDFVAEMNAELPENVQGDND